MLEFKKLYAIVEVINRGDLILSDITNLKQIEIDFIESILHTEKSTSR